MDNTNELTERTENQGFINSLEGRLLSVGFHAAACGFFTYGVMDQVAKGNYGLAMGIAVMDIGSALSGLSQAGKAVETYGRRK